jgi:uncharacterized membrane protein YkvA (DUF1232 family)
MKISKVQVQLNGEDILSIINDIFKIDGLKLHEVHINNLINIEGEYKKRLNIKFEVTVEVEGVRNGKIYGKFSKFKVMNLGFFRPIRSMALKLALKKLELKGVSAEKDKFEVDIDKALMDVPFVNVSISNLFVQEELLHAEVEDINISLKGELIKVEEEKDVIQDEEEILSLPLNKIEDKYTDGRRIVEAKMSKKLKTFSEYILIIPDVVALIYRLLKDKRVSKKTKIAISISLGYVLCPIDIIPDQIPFIGKIDDLAILFFALNRIAKDVPLNVILENWQGKNEVIVVMKNGLDYIINFTGAKNVEKLYSVIEELGHL